MDRVDAVTHLMLVEVVKDGEEPGDGIVVMRGTVGWSLQMDAETVALSIIPTGTRVGFDTPYQFDHEGTAAIARMPRDTPVGEFFAQLRRSGSGVIHEALFGPPSG